MKSRTAAISRPATHYAVGDLIALADAVALFSAQDMRPHDSARSSGARMRDHIRVAVTNGQLAQTIKHGKKHYVFGRIAAWAQDKWPGKYRELPSTRDPSVNRIGGILGGLSGRSSGDSIPSTLAECQEQLRSAMGRILALEEELELVNLEVARSRSDTETGRRQRAANRQNASKRRKGGLL